MKISNHTLGDLYKRHKVTYIKPQYAYCRKMANKAEIGEWQQRCVFEIAKLMKAGKQVIYIDESQFHK